MLVFALSVLAIGVILPLICYKQWFPRPYSSDKKTALLGSGEMFDSIADYYDVANRFMSFGNDFYWRRELADSLYISSDMRILDLATGTGDVALAIARLCRLKHKFPVHITGVDPSPNMLHIARQKALVYNHTESIHFTLGSAEYLPFNSDSFDLITISFGIRNVKQRNLALQEIHRVLTPQSNQPNLFIMEFVAPVKGILAPLARFTIRYITPTIGVLFSGGNTAEYHHLKDSIMNFPSAEDFLLELESNGFSNCVARNIFFDVVYIFQCVKKDAKLHFN